MPRSNSPARATFVRLAFFAVVGWALVALTRRNDDVEHETVVAASPGEKLARETRTVEAPHRRTPSGRRRLATSLAFTTLFFAGAAFSAGAGDMLAEAVESKCDPAAEMTGENAEACAAAEAAEEGSADEATADEGDATTTEPEGAGTDDVTGEETTEDGDGAGDPADTGEPTDGDDSTEGEEPTDEDGDGSDPGTDDGDADGADGDGTDGTAGGNGGGAGESDGGHGHDGGGNGGGGNGDGEPAGEPILDLPEEDEAADLEPLDPEAEAGGSVATVWLHRTLPDPIPVAERLSPQFARQLRAESRRAGVAWFDVLAALRVQGGHSSRPANRAELRETAERLHDAFAQHPRWEAFLTIRARTSFADRAVALSRYNEAVGLRALVRGFAAVKDELEARVLADERLDIYLGGRADIQSGRIDVRVLVLLRYLAETYGQVTVSSLDSGHGVYARPGVVSAHKYGLAVDIAVLGGKPILGNSAPGELTEDAVRNILLLPSELRPQQVISLLGVGGPSFPMANHHDHIHVGF